MSDEKPSYRLLTGVDDHAFCVRVSDALAEGYVLYGAPAITYNGQSCIVAQAVVLPEVAASAVAQESKHGA